MLLAALLAFVAGALAAALMAWSQGWLDPRRLPVQVVERPAVPAPLVSASAGGTAELAAAQVGADVAAVAAQQGGLEQRLIAAEQRLAQIDLRSQAAAGNVARAEGLLIAFAARRAVERGTPLGYLEHQLQLRFGEAVPNAVSTVVNGARAPVTLDQLLTRLDGLRGSLSTRPRELSWQALREEMASLFVIRRDTTPGLQPERRLERARLFLESGRVPAAIAEVRMLPGARNGEAWIADASRYAAMQQALDLIETAAVLEPRRLRDGEGALVEQASPLDREGAAGAP
ncbi:MICOS complex subunit MIC60 [Qipengyuania thermophila]|uniref:MICOS complex subunit MIC60 n=1 Tax=Qipengyuania thermophila TaxID=2509361 RepID=UPI001F3F7971|nr:MICOS complex subunit MIC60 [Qipengyuania thermophila]